MILYLIGVVFVFIFAAMISMESDDSGVFVIALPVLFTFIFIPWSYVWTDDDPIDIDTKPLQTIDGNIIKNIDNNCYYFKNGPDLYICSNINVSFSSEVDEPTLKTTYYDEEKYWWHWNTNGKPSKKVIIPDGSTILVKSFSKEYTKTLK